MGELQRTWKGGESDKMSAVEKCGRINRRKGDGKDRIVKGGGVGR